MRPVRIGSLRLNISSRDDALDLIGRSATSPGNFRVSRVSEPSCLQSGCNPFAGR